MIALAYVAGLFTIPCVIVFFWLTDALLYAAGLCFTCCRSSGFTIGKVASIPRVFLSRLTGTGGYCVGVTFRNGDEWKPYFKLRKASGAQSAQREASIGFAREPPP